MNLFVASATAQNDAYTYGHDSYYDYEGDEGLSKHQAAKDVSSGRPSVQYVPERAWVEDAFVPAPDSENDKNGNGNDDKKRDADGFLEAAAIVAAAAMREVR